MSPLTFTWATETAATRSFGGTGSGNWAGHSNAGLILQGDFNGDGKQDVARYTGSSSHDVCLSTGSNYSCSTWPSSNATWPSTVGDFNGDGRSDIGGYAITFVQQGKTPDGEIFGYYRHHIFVCLNSGSAFPCTQWKADAFNVNGFSGEPPAYNGIVADFNGDGRSDWAYWHQASSSWMVCLSTGGGFNCGAWNGPTTGIGANVAGDFNGDGMEDLLGSAGGSNWKVCLSSGAGFSCSTWPGADSSAWPVFGDFNGDGLQDMARYVSGSNWNVCLSTGSGFSCANWSGMVVPAESYTKTGDFNGDGKKDLARSLGGGSWNVCLSTGSGFSCSTWTGTSATFEATFIGDFNGDGKDDLTGYLSGSTWNTTLAGDPFPDLTTGISNSLGNTVSLVYRPLTAAEVYSKDTDATLPNQDLQPATHVVRMQTLDNGAGGTSATNYFYKGLKRNFDRAALLGFREVEETETLTGNKIAVSRRQDWPYAGLPSVVRRTQSSGAILTETTNTYSCKNPATGAACTVAAGNRYFPYVSQSVETGNDLNGAALPTLTTSTEYDLYGNATTITAGTGDGYSKTTTNVFTNDVPNWLLGRLTRSTVQSISP
jgi:hypothetical protein